jgi:hypothetical protein
MTKRGRGWARALRERGATSLAATLASFGICSADATGAPLDLTLPLQSSPQEEVRAQSGDAAPAFSWRGRFAAAGSSDELTPAQDSALLTVGSDESVVRRLSFEAKNLAVDYGTLDISFAAGSQITTDTLTLDRLMQTGAFDGTDVQSTTVAAKLQLFDRMTVSSRLALSDWQVGVSTAFRDGATDATTRYGGATWHDLNAKLYDDGDIRWSFSAQLGVVDPDYRAPSGMRVAGSPVVSGTRTFLTSRVQSGDLSLSIAQQSIDGPVRDLHGARATLGFSGGQLTVYRRDTDTDAAAQSRAVKSIGVTAELYGSDLFADMPALAKWTPELISVTAENIEDRNGLSPDTASGATFSAVVSWRTVFGETGLTYWQKALEASALRVPEDDLILDVSHQVSLGPWRAAFGVSYESFITEDTDRGFSGHASLSYAPSDGPELKFGIDRRQSETLFEADLMAQQMTGLDLTASLDVTPYLRSAFDWSRTTAKVEYRRELRADRFDGAATDSATEALLASFATPL